jgi:hypothetical protein
VDNAKLKGLDLHDVALSAHEYSMYVVVSTSAHIIWLFLACVRARIGIFNAIEEGVSEMYHISESNLVPGTAPVNFY